MLMIGAILFGSNQIMPQLLQTSFQYTAMLSGFALMPGGIAMLLLMPLAGLVTGRIQPKYLMVLGLTLIALSMWYSTSLVPDASFGYFSWLRVFQMAGLPFLFIPISTVGYDGLPRDKTNQASALMNVARNLGGGIGISLANAELAQRSQFHQARLVENATSSSTAFQSTLRQMSQYFMQHGSAQGGRTPPSDWADRTAHRTAVETLGLYRRFPALCHYRHSDGPYRAYFGSAGTNWATRGTCALSVNRRQTLTPPQSNHRGESGSDNWGSRTIQGGDQIPQQPGLLIVEPRSRSIALEFHNRNRRSDGEAPSCLRR